MTHLTIAIFAAAALAGGVLAFRWLASKRGSAWIRGHLEARALGLTEGRELREVVREQARRTGIREPSIEVTPHDQVNVFVLADASGQPSLIVTRGLLHGLGRESLEAVVAAAVARIEAGHVTRITSAVALALGPSAIAGLGALRIADAEEGGVGWLPSLLLVPFGALVARLTGAPHWQAETDVAGIRGVGRAREGARTLEHMEFTAHAAPMRLPAAIAGLALVNPLGSPSALSLARLFPLPEPSAARVEALRQGVDQPWRPDARLVA